MSLGHGASIVRDGLVLHLDAANVKSYSGSGTTWYDLSGNGNNGTLVNGVTYQNLNNGTLTFDGTNQYINIPDSEASRFNHDSPWSISIIVNPISQNTSFPGYLIKGGSVGDGVVMFYSSSGTYWKHNNQQTNVIPTVIGQLVCFTLSYTGSGSIEGYVNGEYSKQFVAPVSTNTTSSLKLGTGDAYGNVNVYNFMKYNKALTESEVKQNFEALRGRYGI